MSSTNTVYRSKHAAVQYDRPQRLSPSSVRSGRHARGPTTGRIPATTSLKRLNIAFAVSDVATELPGYTTTRLARTAARRGHRVWFMGAGDFGCSADNRTVALARAADDPHRSLETFLAHIQDKAPRERIDVDSLDVLMLRSDPSIETGERAWAQSAGVRFGRMAMRHGVIVLNDPDGLTAAANKLYFQLFPESVRPLAIVARDPAEIRAFARAQGGTIVLKPLQGSSGQSVFLVHPGNLANIDRMIDAVCRDGYAIAQEYLPAATQGDLRLFLMNGVPLRCKGRFAAFRRVRRGDDLRSNVHAGGKIRPARITDTALQLADIVRPKLVQDGMFFVGLDIVGDRLMEINVFNPGGLGSAQLFEKVDFTSALIEALERKVACARSYGNALDNTTLNTL